MVSRRGVLKLVGGGTVLAAGSVGAFVAMNGPSRAAREPWRQAGLYESYRKRALSYALLAPNPHNLQPWQVSLDGEDALTLYHDPERRLPATDPFDRQITIGCGAFLELLSIAAAEDGYRTEITAFPDGSDLQALDHRPVARVTFHAGRAKPDPLFAHILARRSNKEVYENRDVDTDKRNALVAAGAVHGQTAGCIGNDLLAVKLRDLTWRAHQMEVMTDYTYQESVDLMRIGAKEVTNSPDGIELEGPMIAAGRLLGLVNRKTLADPSSSAFRQGLDMYRAMAMSARGFAWISNSNATRQDQINAGRAYARLNLKATELGIGVHPWSQSLQEYPEMAELYREVHDLVGGGERLQMLVRIGYGPKIMPTPRRGLGAHLV